MLHSFSSRTGCTASAATEESDVAPASGAAPSTWTQQIRKRGPSDTSVFKRVKFLILTARLDSGSCFAAGCAIRCMTWSFLLFFFSGWAEAFVRPFTRELLWFHCFEHLVNDEFQERGPHRVGLEMVYLRAREPQWSSASLVISHKFSWKTWIF